MTKCGVTASCRVNKDSGVRDEKVIQVSAAFSHVGKKRHEDMKHEEKNQSRSPRPVRIKEAHHRAGFVPQWLRPKLLQPRLSEDRCEFLVHLRISPQHTAGSEIIRLQISRASLSISYLSISRNSKK